jgi:NAD(P)H-hydrate epimerase
MPLTSGEAATALLTAAEMARADAAAIAAGTPGIDLMERAGAVVAAAALARWPRRPVMALCGPGNNGGDGFVAARLLRAAGWPVRVALLGRAEALKGDAALAAQRWDGPAEPLAVPSLAGDPLVIDALFGAGLARPLEATARAVVEEIGRRGLACIAVDLPSGVNGDTGAVQGAAPPCAATVTFFRPKPGHLLLPGRSLAGEIVLADIGIGEAVLEAIAPRHFQNDPVLWRRELPWPTPQAHKFARGHALVIGGERMTGAARLAAQAARRVGAGLVTVACPPERFAVYAGDAPGVLVQPLAGCEGLAALAADARITAVLIGPGAGRGARTRAQVLAVLGAGKPCLLDADALTVFAEEPDVLFSAIRSPCLMTPHEGELKRLFPAAAAESDKIARARAAAARGGAVVLLKGSDTVIAAPDGRVIINGNAPPTLATAGAGDVLAGLAVGLLAQGVAPLHAAAMAAWLHGAAASAAGAGLIAEDLPEALSGVLGRLRPAAALARPGPSAG